MISIIHSLANLLIFRNFVASELQSLSNNSVRKNAKHDMGYILLGALFEGEKFVSALSA